jgi:hypothetical protein
LASSGLNLGLSCLGFYRFSPLISADRFPDFYIDLRVWQVEGIYHGVAVPLVLITLLSGLIEVD